jgi:dihydrolipoamide dehydrogenase
MTRYDLAVVGGGPGGYVAALRGAQLGLKVVLFEKECIGGLCLNWGCIPSKAILRNADVVNLVRDAEKWGIGGTRSATFDLGSAIDRSRGVVDKLVGGVEGLLRDADVKVVSGAASFKTATSLVCNGDTYQAASVIIATGAGMRTLPGASFDGKTIISSREALALRKTPAKAIVIGAGPIGVEFAHIWASYGSEVTLVELLDSVLPLEDPDIGRVLKRSFEARGITCLTGYRVESVTTAKNRATVTVASGSESRKLDADVVLVAVGFVPHTEGLNLETAGVATERGFVTIDDRMKTNVPGIYAIGDVTGKLMLAHVAMEQGVIAAEQVAGKKTARLDYIQLPRATFCQPQVASIGYTEQQAKAAGFAVKTGRFPLTALGKSIAVGETDGFVKVIADEATGQVLGIHMIGHDVNELLGEATMVAMLEATTTELGFAVHAHPTLGEAMKEAALAVDGQSIHLARHRTAPTAR